MKKSYIFLLIVVFIVLIAVLTNPNQSRHKEEFKTKLNEYIQKYNQGNKNNSENEFEAAGNAIGTLIGGALVDNLISSKSYILFSTTEITWEGQTKTIGIGIFGNVYLSNSFIKAMNENERKSDDKELISVLEEQKKSLTNELKDMMSEFDGLKTDADVRTADGENFNKKIEKQQNRIKQVLSVSTTNIEKIKLFRRELNSLREIMKSYIVEIDSLSSINRQ